ncbi:uncharacterized protein P174DRAFT_437249 [Aspergillus novofumigatus IBT 16806]|uniref:Uncharacterized protein n=1 Tax=Aspergillus novofumigatus (strain IBT 16806) TaxID=1392255 RepID=A0A2I1CMG5_ASPN1|nr:uncharacterized protein P174DRAFT_437249 [Aspergillus novofumigatus IBT 16806]PKX98821.1 hypothetical protein P174DRAFT_437249 [Aspergillus novofumigatus IBT 16806]
MADTEYNAEEAAEIKKRRQFRKFTYRGIDLDQYVQQSPIQGPLSPANYPTPNERGHQLYHLCMGHPCRSLELRYRDRLENP